jgi:hypothetical protein
MILIIYFTTILDKIFGKTEISAPFPQISMLFASMQRFRRDISTENDNIDIGGGMSATMSSLKLVNAHIPRQKRKKGIKKHYEVGIAKLFCPRL